jgi:hypothetical protein
VLIQILTGAIPFPPDVRDVLERRLRREKGDAVIDRILRNLETIRE